MVLKKKKKGGGKGVNYMFFNSYINNSFKSPTLFALIHEIP